MTNNNSLQPEGGVNRRKDKTALRRLSRLLLFFSGFLCVLLLLAYTIQPDFCAAVTFWPLWIWAIIGIILSLAGFGFNKRVSLFVIFIWVLFVGFVSEETSGLLRSIVYFNRECKNTCTSGNCLRVVSLNCAGGSASAADEIIQYEPDIVLLQESPPLKDLKVLVNKLFNDCNAFALEGNTAILARGHVRKTEDNYENRMFMAGARIVLSSGLEIETINVHLPPPASSINLFSPECWREHRDDRRMRLKQITAVKEHFARIKDDVPLVVGGDFNASPWTQATKVLSSRLYDTFKRGGVGWPGTGPSHFPLWRVDQIWTSRHFKTVKVWSESCKNSDHRVVICDLCRL